MSVLATSGLFIPTDNSLSMGGGPSIYTIRVKDDFTDVYASAEWNVIPLLESVDISPAGQGGNNNQTVQLMHNKTVVVRNTNTAADDVTLEIPIVTLFDEDAIDEFLYTRKNWKEFIGIPTRYGAAMKKVFWAYGKWSQSSTKNIAGFTPNKRTLTFVVEPHGLASGAITFPVLPVGGGTPDAAFDGSAYSMEYLAWILGSSDAALGGIGYAVTVPTITELPGDKLGCFMTYDS